MGLSDDAKKEMTGAVDHFSTELRSMRTGRAHPALLSKVIVEVYGTQMRLTELANISASDANQLVVVPFDKANTAAIGKAIEKANLGVQVVAEGHQVRVRIPPMTQESRLEMIKEAKKGAEQAKVSIRSSRRKFNDKARQMGLPEDQLHREEKTIQSLTDDFCKKCDELASAKEKELSTI
jgi:ribosome recycling factor